MSETTIWVLVTVCAVVSIGLLIKIVTQLRYLRTHKEESESIRDKIAQKTELKRATLDESILVLCGSMVDDQVEISEGCMRVKVLLDHYDARLHNDQQLGVFNKVYQRLESMPRFEQRKEVDRRVLEKLDETRRAVEDEYRDRVLAASKCLIDRISNKNK